MPHIFSNPDPASPQPWFDFDFDGENFIVRECNGLAASKETKANKATEAALKKSHKVKKKVGKESETHVLAITLEGVVEFIPQSEQRPVYYAHLAWVHPDGTIESLEFVEGT
jgi:hypothetical protein